MDLKRRLGRLGSAPPLGQTSGEAPAPPEADTGRVELDDLRARMAAILGKPAPPRPEPADPTLTTLPFVREETEWGPRYRRLERLRPSHHVGRMPVDAALTARSEVLALLALDSTVAEAELKHAVYFDTETTGLGGAGVVAFLVGVCWFDEDGAPVLEQLLLRRPGEERPILERFAELVRGATLLVSYNGKSFDWPMLQARNVMNRLPPLPNRPHLDLLHVGRRLHRERLGACRLVTLESEVLGFVRGEDIDGAEVPSRYSHFLRTGDEAALEAVVEHNAWDVVSMAALVGLYGEPLDGLQQDDLVALARTYRRAKALERATEAATRALARGAGPEALRTRAMVAKARGDRAAALRDFAELAATIDDEQVRLELAKLYEHHVKEPLQALDLTLRGTGESPEAHARRQRRLEKKIERARQRRK
jgi:uncharacterized protein YprB with RNaseH-like and TPR domain